MSKIYPDCPIFDWDCPYCLASRECIIDNPIAECDIYYLYNSDEDLKFYTKEEDEDF